MEAAQSEYKWHLHDGTEGVYQDPMGRRTPLRVIRVHNTMATVEFLSGKTGRVSCRRITAPTYTEALQHWPTVAAEMASEARRKAGLAVEDDMPPKFGLIHNGMPKFFEALKAAVQA